MAFVIGVVGAAFAIGGRSQKIHDLEKWKNEVAPRIERMDSVGSLSFDHFKAEYTRDRERTEHRLEKLEEKDP